MLAIGLLILGVVSRLITHVPNFTPIIAVALFGGFYLKKNQALVMPLILLAISDLIIGFHNTMLFTWGSIFLISALGMALRGQKNFSTITISSFASSVIFFIITNLGVWLVSGLYSMTLSGLRDCFILAIPFFKTELLSTLIYTAVLFGTYEYASVRLKHTRFAHVL